MSFVNLLNFEEASTLWTLYPKHITENSIGLKLVNKRRSGFCIARHNDPDLQTFLSDFPDDYQKLIEMFIPN